MLMRQFLDNHRNNECAKNAHNKQANQDPGPSTTTGTTTQSNNGAGDNEGDKVQSDVSISDIDE